MPRCTPACTLTTKLALYFAETATSFGVFLFSILCAWSESPCPGPTGGRYSFSDDVSDMVYVVLGRFYIAGALGLFECFTAGKDGRSFGRALGALDLVVLAYYIAKVIAYLQPTAYRKDPILIVIIGIYGAVSTMCHFALDRAMWRSTTSTTILAEPFRKRLSIWNIIVTLTLGSVCIAAGAFSLQIYPLDYNTRDWVQSMKWWSEGIVGMSREAGFAAIEPTAFIKCWSYSNTNTTFSLTKERVTAANFGMASWATASITGVPDTLMSLTWSANVTMRFTTPYPKGWSPNQYVNTPCTITLVDKGGFVIGSKEFTPISAKKGWRAKFVSTITSLDLALEVPDPAYRDCDAACDCTPGHVEDCIVSGGSKWNGPGTTTFNETTGAYGKMRPNTPFTYDFEVNLRALRGPLIDGVVTTDGCGPVLPAPKRACFKQDATQGQDAPRGVVFLIAGILLLCGAMFALFAMIKGALNARTSSTSVNGGELGDQLI